MRLLRLLPSLAMAALAIVCLPAAAAAQAPTLMYPATADSNVGVEVSFTVTAQANVAGRTVTVSHSALPSGATFQLISAVGATTNYQFKWTRQLGQPGASICYQATDSAGVPSLGSHCTQVQEAVAQIHYVSGILRDFNSSHPDMNRPANENAPPAPNFVHPILGADGKPVFSPVTPTVTKFHEWFNDVPGVNTRQVHSILLTDAFQPPGTFNFRSPSWFPAGAGNKFFTYEIQTSINYIPGQTFTFRSSDDMWVFINGRLVPGWSLYGVHADQAFTVNMDALAVPMNLIAGGTYPLSIFYANRGSTSTPSIQIQANRPELCTPLTAGVTAVDVNDGQFTPSDVNVVGFASINNGNVRVIRAAGSVTSGAAWTQKELPLGRGFSAKFGFRITNASNFDGFAMVVGNTKTARGGDGANLGYAGISRNLAIEFDSKQDAALGDPPFQHISIHTQGAAPNSASENASIGIQSPAAPPNFFQNGSSHEVRVEYTPDDHHSFGWLRVWMNQNLIPSAEAQVNDSVMASILNAGGKGYLGFTSANSLTGGADVDITSLEIQVTGVSPGLSRFLDLPESALEWIDGVGDSFSFQLYDACNAPITTGGLADLIDVNLVGPHPLPSTLTDIGDGTYVVSYDAPISWGKWNLNVLVDGGSGPVHIMNSPLLTWFMSPDYDGDGFREEFDNCPGFDVPNPDQLDTDDDDAGDACDADDDGDGIADAVDACPVDVRWRSIVPVPPDFKNQTPILSTSQNDFEGDGCWNDVDPDDDNDGKQDNFDQCPAGNTGWTSNGVTDHDDDGCRDAGEDADDDNDGRSDATDNCPLAVNPSQADFDFDGAGDACDADDDNDTAADAVDNCPTIANPDQLNTDADSLGDACDPDDDNDGFIDVEDNCPAGDTGWTSNSSTDHDNDGCRDAGEDTDDDNDGKLDAADACPAGGGSGPDQDNDGCTDVEDADDDNDSVNDAADNCPSAANADQANADGDERGDVCDVDDDNDTVADAVDNCQFAFNIDQANNDGDAQGDVCDADDDNDGAQDGSDNCPLLANPDQGNHDGDAQGNACDLDDDNDALPDAVDACPAGNTGWSTNPQTDRDMDGCRDAGEDADDDNDGKADGADSCPAGDTGWTSNGATDRDDDGCRDASEDLDDDADGKPDTADSCPAGEIGWTSSPSNDQDNDGCRDGGAEDVDDDNDTVADGLDNCPLVFNLPQLNLDGDAQGDACDPDDDNDGAGDAADNCPIVANPDQQNTDGDAEGNICDADDDNDGTVDDFDNCLVIANPSQADHDGDFQGDACDADDDNDGVPDTSDACPTEAGTGPNGCNAPATTLVGPLAPFKPGASYNSKQAVPLKWQYASGGGAVASPGANPVIRFYGTVACGATAGGSPVPAQSTGGGMQYDAATKTWQFNWKPSLPAGGYYFTVTNQQTGDVAGPFAVCLGR